MLRYFCFPTLQVGLVITIAFSFLIGTRASAQTSNLIMQGVADKNPRDSTFSKYENGVYSYGWREHVGLEEFRKSLFQKYTQYRNAEIAKAQLPGSLPSAVRSLSVNNDIDVIFAVPAELLIPLATDVMLSWKSAKTERAAGVDANGNIISKQEKAFTASPTALTITTTLISVEQMLDDLLNRANSAASSALFAMRGHVAASISDLNVVFKNRMDETMDRMSEHEQKILTQAQVLAAQANITVKEVAEKGFEQAADLVCQTTVGLANFNPLSKLFDPDIVCLKEQNIRDAGANFEQLLTFRGVNLIPGDDYAKATIQLAGSTITSVTAGGNSILLLPLPGGLNGNRDDLTIRGERLAEVEFNWRKSNITRRWLFPVRPYLVRSLKTTIIPLIKGPVRKRKEQTCSVHVNGGTAGSREEYTTCTIVADDGWTVESCLESPPTSATSDAGIRNRLFTAGACQWEMHAKSGGWWGGGAWYAFIGTAVMKKDERVRGTPFESSAVVNQNVTSAIFQYPSNLIPTEYTALDGEWWYTVLYQDTEGREHTFTQTQPTNPNLGVITAMDKGQVTVTVPPR